MKKVIVLAYFLCAISPAIATNDKSATSKTAPNNSTQKKSGSEYLKIPFNVNLDKFPMRFEGHSLLGIVKSITPAKGKGEFEKTEEYEARIERWKSSPYHGKVTPADSLIFELSELLAPDAYSLKYDADKEEMTAIISFENQYFSSGTTRWLETFYSQKNLGSRPAVTRMGVKFNVTSYSVNRIGLAINEPLENISITWSLPRINARDLKSQIRAFAVGKLVDPYIVDSVSASTASLDRPREFRYQYLGLWFDLNAIWLVDSKTGQVIRKESAPFQKCSYSIC